jgi:hypothetical protein
MRIQPPAPRDLGSTHGALFKESWKSGKEMRQIWISAATNMSRPHLPCDVCGVLDTTLEYRLA